MNQGTTVLAQIIAFVDYETFRSCVRRYDGDYRVRDLSCWEQFLTMAFAQLTHRESLRDIEVSLAAHRRKLYHSGFRSAVKRYACRCQCKSGLENLRRLRAEPNS